MTDYISREALGIGKCNPDVFEDKGYAKGWNSAVDVVMNIPAADVVPVRHGRWVKVHDEVCYWLACSVCGEKIPKRFGTDYYTNFCPNCGADMREES